jgi:hypothetical protein
MRPALAAALSQSDQPSVCHHETAESRAAHPPIHREDDVYCH